MTAAVREATRVFFPDSTPIKLLDPWFDWQHGNLGEVTRITVTCDLPGVHCFLDRFRIYVGGAIVSEGPVYLASRIDYAPVSEFDDVCEGQD
ncbi:MAG: hypothetical protein AAF479_10620 [Pseudomonadota bacterium]